MKDVVLSERRETLQDLWYAVEEYIEFYNNHRYQKKLKKDDPDCLSGSSSVGSIMFFFICSVYW